MKSIVVVLLVLSSALCGHLGGLYWYQIVTHFPVDEPLFNARVDRVLDACFATGWCCTGIGLGGLALWISVGREPPEID